MLMARTKPRLSKPVRFGVACIVGVSAWYGVIVPLHRVLNPALARLQAAWEYKDCNQRGNQLYREHDYAGAKAQYRRMIALRPTQDSGYLLCGWVDYAMKRYRDGVADNTQALQWAKDDLSRAAILHNRGINYMGLKTWGAAADDFAQSLRFRPADAETREQFAFASAFHSLDEARHGRYIQAVDEMQTALRYKARPEWWSVLGWYQCKAGQIGAALASCRTALKLDRNPGVAHCNLALCYAIQGDGDAMRREYKTAMAQPGQTDWKDVLADVSDELGKHPESKTLYEAQTIARKAQADTPVLMSLDSLPAPSRSTSSHSTQAAER